MKHINYDDATATVFLDHSAYPPASSGTIAIYTSSGEELLAEEAVTLYAETSLASAASAGDTTFTLDALAGDLEEGDLVQFANPKEVVEVKKYDAATKTVTGKAALVYDRESGDAVYGASLTHSIDTTSDFENGQSVILAWTIGDDSRREIALVSSSAYSYHNVLRRLELMYPVTYGLIGDDKHGYMSECRDVLKEHMSLIGHDIDSMPDSSKVDHLLLFYSRWLILSRGGESWEAERDSAWADFLRVEDRFSKQPLWQDDDFDNVEETGEDKTGKSLPMGRSF